MSDSNGLNLPTTIPNLPVGGSEGEVELSDFAQGILSQIPEEDRPVVGKYYKDWDKNVTKRFQSIHEEYKPYKELGEPNDIKDALQWIGMLNEDPVTFVKNIQQAMKESGIMWDDDIEEEEETSNLPEYEGLPQSVVDKIRALEETIGGLTESVNNFTMTSQEEKEQAALDNLLGSLHNEYGNFDDDWVTLQIARGMEPSEAAEAFFSEFIPKYSSSQATRKPAPNLFSGASGSVPNQVDTSTMTKAEKMAMAVAALQAANNQN